MKNTGCHLDQGESENAEAPSFWPSSFDSALNAFLALNDYIYKNGATYFGTVVPQSLGLIESNSGTYQGTCFYSDGTTLGISLGPVCNGTQTPIKVGFELRNSIGTEVARIDWNLGAKRERDRNPHIHFWDESKRQSLSNWPALRTVVSASFGVPEVPLEGANSGTYQP